MTNIKCYIYVIYYMLYVITLLCFWNILTLKQLYLFEYKYENVVHKKRVAFQGEGTVLMSMTNVENMIEQIDKRSSTDSAPWQTPMCAD